MRCEGVVTKRRGMPVVSEAGRRALDSYVSALRSRADMRPATLRNYLSTAPQKKHQEIDYRKRAAA